MGAKLTTEGFDGYFDDLISLSKEAEGICKAAVFEGAKVMADTLRGAVSAIPENNGRFVPGDLPIEGISKRQKEGLLNGLGVARIATKGSEVNTKIGFIGYNSEKTRKYPGGQPNMLIARSLMKGTNKRKKYDFVSAAVRQASAPAVAAMAEKVTEEINKKMEG